MHRLNSKSNPRAGSSQSSSSRSEHQSYNSQKIERKLQRFLSEFKPRALSTEIKYGVTRIVNIFKKYGGYIDDVNANVSHSTNELESKQRKSNMSPRKVATSTPKYPNTIRKAKTNSEKVNKELSRLADSATYVSTSPLSSKRQSKAVQRFDGSQFEKNVRSLAPRTRRQIDMVHQTIAKNVGVSMTKLNASVSSVRKIRHASKMLSTTVSSGRNSEGSMEQTFEHTVTTQKTFMSSHIKNYNFKGRLIRHVPLIEVKRDQETESYSTFIENK